MREQLKVFTKSMYRTKDHPRVCGNNHYFHLVLWNNLGSPPRMREQQGITELRQQQGRITPAYAGTTPSSLWWALLVEDHPRVCGNNFLS